MLRIPPLADDLILPQARQEIYFFNRIGRLLPDAKDKKARSIAGFVNGFSYGARLKLLRNSSSSFRQTSAIMFFPAAGPVYLLTSSWHRSTASRA